MLKGTIIACHHTPTWWVACGFPNVYSLWISSRGMQLLYAFVFHMPKPEKVSILFFFHFRKLKKKKRKKITQHKNISTVRRRKKKEEWRKRKKKKKENIKRKLLRQLLHITYITYTNLSYAVYIYIYIYIYINYFIFIIHYHHDNWFIGL